MGGKMELCSPVKLIDHWATCWVLDEWFVVCNNQLLQFKDYFYILILHSKHYYYILMMHCKDLCWTVIPVITISEILRIIWLQLFTVTLVSWLGYWFSSVHSEFGKSPQLMGFIGSHLLLRRMDGSLMSTTIAPYPAILHGFVGDSRWEDAVRLCRFVKVRNTWAFVKYGWDFLRSIRIWLISTHKQLIRS